LDRGQVLYHIANVARQDPGGENLQSKEIFRFAIRSCHKIQGRQKYDGTSLFAKDGLGHFNTGNAATA
jgi:hypothetical protein